MANSTPLLMESLSSGIIASSAFCSYAESSPRPWIFSTPSLPSVTLVAKKSTSVTVLDVGALHHVGLAVFSAKARIREERSGVRHGESRGALASLGGDDLGTSVLGALGERVDDVVGHRHRGRRLREEREDGDARVTANHGDVNLGRLQTVLLGVEGLGADDVEGGDAEELLGVVHALLLENLRGDGHGGVDGVGDHVDHGFGAVRGARLGEARDDARVDLEESRVMPGLRGTPAGMMTTSASLSAAPSSASPA